MKIHIDRIPGEGMELTEQIDPRKISLDLETQGILLTAPVMVKAEFKKVNMEVFVDIDLETSLEYTCARCLAKFQGPFNKKFNIIYDVNPGDVLEIDDDIRQEMILDYPMKVLCRPDCKGLCPNCGQNLNVAKCECNL
jgi:uncharacterized protein